MCAVFELNGKVSKPGQEILARAKEGLIQHVWAGFARSEILDWWERHGGVELDIFVSRFAERSERSRKLVWADAPAGRVIRGLLVPDPVCPLVKIVTRASTPAEYSQFEHPRMPLLGAPLFGEIPTVLPQRTEQQPDLFG